MAFYFFIKYSWWACLLFLYLKFLQQMVHLHNCIPDRPGVEPNILNRFLTSNLSLTVKPFTPLDSYGRLFISASSSISSSLFLWNFLPFRYNQLVGITVASFLIFLGMILIIASEGGSLRVSWKYNWGDYLWHESVNSTFFPFI